jgi:hypothetical protein
MASQDVFLGDFEKMEGHWTHVAREMWMMLCMRGFHHSYHSQLSDLMRRQFSLKGVGTFGTTYEQGNRMGSGSPETASANAALNAFAAWSTLYTTVGSLLYGDAQRCYHALGIYLGDDGMTGDMNPIVARKRARELGQVLTGDVVKRGQLGINFLARIYGPHVWNGSLSSCCDLKRQLSKYHTCVKLPSNIEPIDKAFAKAYAYNLSDRKTPILGQLTHCILKVCRTADISFKWELMDPKYEIMRYDQTADPSVQYPNDPEDGWMMQVVNEQLPEFDYNMFAGWVTSVHELCEIVENSDGDAEDLIAVVLSPPLCYDDLPPKKLPDEAIVADGEIMEPVIGASEQSSKVLKHKRIPESSQATKPKKDKGKPPGKKKTPFSVTKRKNGEERKGEARRRKPPKRNRKKRSDGATKSAIMASELGFQPRRADMDYLEMCANPKEYLTSNPPALMPRPGAAKVVIGVLHFKKTVTMPADTYAMASLEIRSGQGNMPCLVSALGATPGSTTATNATEHAELVAIADVISVTCAELECCSEENLQTKSGNAHPGGNRSLLQTDVAVWATWEQIYEGMDMQKTYSLQPPDDGCRIRWVPRTQGDTRFVEADGGTNYDLNSISRNPTVCVTAPQNANITFRAWVVFEVILGAQSLHVPRFSPYGENLDELLLILSRYPEVASYHSFWSKLKSAARATKTFLEVAGPIATTAGTMAPVIAGMLG